MANSIFKTGQVFKGRLGTYTLSKRLYQRTEVWLARNQENEHCIFKSDANPSWRFYFETERTVLRHYQSKTAHIRALSDEIDNPPGLILKYLDDDVQNASDTKKMSRSEVKFVARGVLEALSTLHKDGNVHTDVKPDNVLVNYSGDENMRFKDVQLADFGVTMFQESPYALKGQPIGTPVFQSPEVILKMRWGTSTDIWSFGAMLINLIYGQGVDYFEPNLPPGHDQYYQELLMRQYQAFGPLPAMYYDIEDEPQASMIATLMVMDLYPFANTVEREVCRQDKDFVCKIMKLDPRDRPSAAQLLEDEWFMAEAQGPEQAEAQRPRLGEGLLKAIEARKDLIPEGTVEICHTGNIPPGLKGPRKHYVVVCIDADGKGTIVHFPSVE